MLLEFCEGLVHVAALEALEPVPVIPAGLHLEIAYLFLVEVIYWDCYTKNFEAVQILQQHAKLKSCHDINHS